MDRSYEELLELAKSLKPPRADKGKKHNYTAQRKKETLPRATRSDKGRARPEQRVSKTKEQVYNFIKAKMYKRDQELIDKGESPLLRGVDENGYYIVVPAAYLTKADYHTQEHQGRNIQHTVRRVCTQKEIDLERYRFNAWQELATSEDWDKPSTYLPEIKQMLTVRYGIMGKEADEAIARRQITNFELFCEFYHLEPSDAAMWDYDTWQSMYSYIPVMCLEDDFIFSLTLRPGTPEFHPEFAYHADKVIRLAKEAAAEEAERRRRQFNEHWRKKS